MKKSVILRLAVAGVCLAASPAFAASDSGSGATLSADGSADAAPAPATPATIKDSALGTDVFGRFFKYQAAEWSRGMLRPR